MEKKSYIHDQHMLDGQWEKGTAFVYVNPDLK